MKASVIFSTYNQTAWLEKTLQGFAAQDRRDFEVIVADDGSNDATLNLIDLLRRRLPYALKHVWQPDDGFQKCKILNQAITASETDYLIFTDGDCIPRADFVSAHLRYRAPRRFLSGGYFKLPMSISEQIDEADISTGRCFDLAWLRRQGLPFSARNVKLAAHGAGAALLDRLVTARASWNGHNASGWKHDVVAANGFDERMGYGGEDRELGERLENAGIGGKRIRHRAVVLHLDHPRGYRTAEALRTNREIRDETQALNRTVTPCGIREAR